MHSALHRHTINDPCHRNPPRALILFEPTNVAWLSRHRRDYGAAEVKNWTIDRTRWIGEPLECSLSLGTRIVRSVASKHAHTHYGRSLRSHGRGYSEAVLAVRHVRVSLRRPCITYVLWAVGVRWVQQIDRSILCIIYNVPTGLEHASDSGTVRRQSAPLGHSLWE